MAECVLVTGAGGFAGRHLCDYLAGLPDRPHIVGVDLAPASPAPCDVFHQVNLSCAESVAGLIEETRPNVIIHLAGTFGLADAHETCRINAFSLVTLMEAVRVHVPEVVMVTMGSAAEYGRVAPTELPVTEQTPCRPVTPYGLSKVLATEIAMHYHRVHPVCVAVVRPFQLIGGGVSTRLAPGAFAEQVNAALATGSKVIKVGNLESSRDFLDVRDAAEAVWMLCKKPAGGEVFNLCSGRPVKMADLLHAMIDCGGADLRIEVDPARMRGKADVSAIYGSYDKLYNHCGWQPRTELCTSVQGIIGC